MELAQSSLGEQLLRFLKNFLSGFHRIFLLFDSRKIFFPPPFFKIFLLKSIKAYLCPNIINFNGVDFSERRPEEVISNTEGESTRCSKYFILFIVENFLLLV